MMFCLVEQEGGPKEKRVVASTIRPLPILYQDKLCAMGWCVCVGGGELCLAFVCSPSSRQMLEAQDKIPCQLGP